MIAGSSSAAGPRLMGATVVIDVYAAIDGAAGRAGREIRAARRGGGRLAPGDDSPRIPAVSCQRARAVCARAGMHGSPDGQVHDDEPGGG